MNGRELDAKIRSMPTEEIEAMLQNEYLQIVRDPKTGRFTKVEDKNIPTITDDAGASPSSRA